MANDGCSHRYRRYRVATAFLPVLAGLTLLVAPREATAE